MWFGAERMLEVVENSKETYPFYLAKDILPVLRQKESQMDGQKLKVSILFSGDTGFYSGTEKIKTELNKNNYRKIRIIPGISSVSYLSAATGIAWQDAKIISIHGKKIPQRPEHSFSMQSGIFPRRFCWFPGWRMSDGSDAG